MPSRVPPRAPRIPVLLVEDDDGVRRSLHLMLHGRGYDVRSYAAAAPLLADPERGSAQCLIADHRLPDSDGIAVLAALRAEGWRGRSVLITGHDAAPLRGAARTAGYDMLLEKPLRPHELIEAIEGAR